MKNRTMRPGATVLAIALLNAPSLAFDGPYVGASVGQAWVDASAGEIENAFAIDDAFVASGTTIDDSGTGWKAYAGYRFNTFFAVEGGYVDLGKASFVTTTTDAPAPLDAITPERFEEVGSGIGGREGTDVDLASAGLTFEF